MKRLLVLGCVFFAVGCKGPVAPAARPQGDFTARERGADGSSGGFAEERTGRRRSRHGGGGQKRGEAERAAAPGQFDFYLLNLSWSPEFCATHGESPECGKGLGFVVHGLWPQDANGDYPEDCSAALGPADPAADTDLMPTVSLVEHEWKTHGTCSGLGVDDYFKAVRTAYRSVRLPVLAEGTPEEMLGALQGANPSFPAGSFALGCGNNRLTAVEVCLGKDLRAESCVGVRSCRANFIKVAGR